MGRRPTASRIAVAAMVALAAAVAGEPHRAGADDCPTRVRFEPTDFGTADAGSTGGFHDLAIVGPTLDLAVSCPASTSPCGTCSVTGLAASQTWQRCQNDTSVVCTTATEVTDCGGPGLCRIYLAPPTSIAAIGSPYCYTARLDGPVGGSVDVESGAFAPIAPVRGEIRFGVYAPVFDGGSNQGCPRCVGDGLANDGVRGGTCDAGPRTGLGCDSHATAAAVDHGQTSFDCPVTPGTSEPFVFGPIAASTAAQSIVLGPSSPRCIGSGGVGQPCFCATCNNAASEACSSNADCPPSGGNPGVCGGKMCVGGPDDGTPCSNTSQCASGGLCGRIGEPTRPNACLDDTTTPNDCADIGGGRGECTSGPVGTTCTNHPNRWCNSDEDCDDVSGACAAHLRSCFLDNGVDGGTVAVAGTATPPVGGIADPTDLASLACLRPMAHSGYNFLIGLPGLSRTRIPGRLLLDPPPVPTATPPAGVTPTPLPTPLAVACPEDVAVCRPALVSGKSTLAITQTANDAKNAFQWKWNRGAATLPSEYGDPTTTASYAMCVYVGGQLQVTMRVPAGGLCDEKPCWHAKPTGFTYRSKSGSPNGVTQMILKAGADGKTRILAKAKGTALPLPNLATLASGDIVVQVRNRESGLCWSAAFSLPFKTLTDTRLKGTND